MNLFNAWIFAVPLLIIGIYLAARHRDTVKRMADMTGYSPREKTVAVIASSFPHLFTLLALFIPLSPTTLAVGIGAPLYLTGLIGFIAAVVSYVRTPAEFLAVDGMYMISRNPMYVAALLSYAGITVLTLNIFLAILLIIMIPFHHLMILSEERICANRFGEQYEHYKRATPRYLFL